jgi:hypothetical protein
VTLFSTFYEFIKIRASNISNPAPGYFWRIWKDNVGRSRPGLSSNHGGDESEVVLVFQDGFFGGVGIVDENEADFPVFEPHPGNDLGNGTALGNFDGVESGSFFKGFHSADGFDENSHGCGFRVAG